MRKLFVDFETYSEVSMKEKGLYPYATHKSTEVLCMAYAWGKEAPKVWVQGEAFPDEVLQHIKDGYTIIGHNVMFEYMIFTHVLKVPITLDQLIDTMALTAMFQVPLALGKAAVALETIHKFDTGTALIKKICMPNKKGIRYKFDINKRDCAELVEYCIQDVAVTQELYYKLRPMIKDDIYNTEMSIWVMTQEMNLVGLPFDVESSLNIYTAIQEYLKVELLKVSQITNGAVTTVNQHARIKKFCIDHGVIIPNTQAKTIEAYLKKILPKPVRDLLELRKAIGSSAIAKYKKGLATAVNTTDWYTLPFSLVYHGAGTGRWAGRGIQPHNFPRAKYKTSKEVEEVIKAFNSQSFEGNPVQAGKKLLRPMICAPPGLKLIVADYSSIENRVLHWVAGDTKTLELFEKGLDQYKDMASDKYNVPYEDVTPDQRFMGKVIILGCGFQMGAKTFRKTAEAQFGLIVSEEEAVEAVNAYRGKYKLIVKLWNKLHKAVRDAVKRPGETFKYGMVSVVSSTSWLEIKMPSGKSLYYKDPAIEMKYIPGYESMGTQPTVTHSGVNPYSKKWGRLTLIPGRITENIVQGTARDIMAQGMLNVRKNLPNITLVGTVHDEAIGIIDGGAQAEFNKELCDVPWTKGLPLKTEGYIERRYKKD